MKFFFQLIGLGRKFEISASLILLLISQQIYSQKGQWPPSEWKDTSVYIRYARGMKIVGATFFANVYLRNGDTLRNCYIRPQHWPTCEILEYHKYTSINIGNETISGMVFFLPSSRIYQNDSIVIRNICKCELLYRLVEKKKGVSIYDNYIGHMDLNKIGKLMYMVFDSGRRNLRICGRESWPSFSSKQHQIIRFIYKRYHIRKKITDFKTDREMLDYVLDCETAKKMH